jgi:hypothetical protein
MAHAELLTRCAQLEAENASLKALSASTAFVLTWVAESSRKQKAGCGHLNPENEGLCNDQCLASLAIFKPQRALRANEGALEWIVKEPQFDIKALLDDRAKSDVFKLKMETAFLAIVNKKYSGDQHLRERDAASMVYLCGLDKKEDGKFVSLLITLDTPEKYIGDCHAELGAVKVNYDGKESTANLIRRCKVCKSVVASREVGHCERCRKPLEDYMRWFMNDKGGRRPHDWAEFREAVLAEKLKDKCITHNCAVTHTVRQCLVGDKAFFSPRCGVAKHHIVDGRMCQECRFRKSETIFDLSSLLATSHTGTGTRGKKRKAEDETDAAPASSSSAAAAAAGAASADVNDRPAPVPLPTKIAAAASTAAVSEGTGTTVPLPIESVVIPTPAPVPIAAMVSASEDGTPAEGAAAAKSGRGSRAGKAAAAKGAPNAQLDILALAAGRRAHE